MQTQQNFIVTSSPHIHSGYTISSAMRDVLFSLVPAAAAAVYFFGMKAFWVMAVSVVAAMIAECICQKIMQRDITVGDGSAALTGLLLAMCLPPALPLWMAALGSVFAIVIGKQVFGGLGCNVFNPAHIGRAMLLASFPAQMTTWSMPQNAAFADAVTWPTPLAYLKTMTQSASSENIMQTVLEHVNLFDMFMGNISGSLGETSVPALLVGGIFLVARKHIDWRIPVVYIGSVYVIMAVYAAFSGYDMSFALYHVLGGGLIIGAFFMATDWVTSPITPKGRIIFAIGLGMLTSLIRLKSGYAEGVCYSILLMNMLAPLIDRYTRRRVFGRDKNE